jgi:hypothetical protein
VIQLHHHLIIRDRNTQATGICYSTLTLSCADRSLVVLYNYDKLQGTGREARNDNSTDKRFRDGEEGQRDLERMTLAVALS